MISQTIPHVKERIAGVASRAGRRPEEITLVAVAKGKTLQQIQEAVSCGIADVGENRVQEALLQYGALKTENRELTTVRWHMVGHLQTNKVKDAVRIFDLIHSLDSLRLAREIDRQAAMISKVQEVLIEVKTSSDAAKSGVSPEDTPALLREIAGLPHIKAMGLMTMAPLADDPEQARPYFRALRQLSERINAQRITSEALRILSMGMTDDFEVAIEEGATMVRLGRAIFEG